MKSTFRTITLGAALLTLSAAPLMAQAGSQSQPSNPSSTTPANQSNPHATPPNTDEQFVKDVVAANMAEIGLGSLATQRGASEAVKTFGRRMMQDHGKALDELKALAATKNIPVSMEINAEQKATHQKLAELSGAAFEREYAATMVGAHGKTVEKFQRYIATGKDPDIKAWASKILPTVQEHLTMAEQLRTKAVGTTGQK